MASLPANDLIIERVGGFAGFGSSGSHLKSKGQCDAAALSASDKARVDALFAHGDQSRTTPAQPDAFRYIISRQTAAGRQTVEVPESGVPDALTACVKDVIE